jgi:hypothetical protein
MPGGFFFQVNNHIAEVENEGSGIHAAKIRKGRKSLGVVGGFAWSHLFRTGATALK